jgi:hypothetical protein
MTVAAPTKLPLWRTIGEAYALWGKQFPALIRICWLWMLVMTPILAILIWWQEPRMMEIIEATRTGEPFADPNPPLTLASQIISLVIMLPPLASIAVAWHRLLLRNENPGGGTYLRLDSVVVGYAILAFWIGLIVQAPAYLSLLFQIATGTSATMRDALAVGVQSLAGLIAIIALFVVARLSIALPAEALGRDDVTFGAAWRATRGNTWRLVWAYFFCSLPMVAVSGGLTYTMFQPDNDRIVVMVTWFAASMLWIPGGMISVGMLSLAYRHFFERGA